MFNGSTEKEIDRVLILAFADGDRQAAQQLTERLMPKIYAHAYYRLGNIADAEDVTQEAFLRLWQFAPRWEQGNAHVSTWLYRVVSNLCKDRYRRPKLEDLDVAKTVVSLQKSNYIQTVATAMLNRVKSTMEAVLQILER